MRSNISCWEISGYFFWSLIACIVGDDDGGDDGRSSGRDTLPVRTGNNRRAAPCAFGGDDGRRGGDDDVSEFCRAWKFAICALTLILDVVSRCQLESECCGVYANLFSSKTRLLYPSTCWLRAGCAFRTRFALAFLFTAIRNVVSDQLNYAFLSPPRDSSSSWLI